MSIGPGKVSHIHSTTRFPFRDMATVIEISRSGESTRGHAATPNENYRKLHPTHMCGLAPPHHAPTRSWGKCPQNIHSTTGSGGAGLRAGENQICSKLGCANLVLHATLAGALRAPACPQTLIFGGTECHPPAQGNTRESACPYIPPPLSDNWPESTCSGGWRSLT